MEIDVYFLCGGEGKGVKYLEKENMFLWWSRRIEMERRKIFEEGKNVFAKENVNGERRRKILGGRILFLWGKRRTKKEKEENIQRWKKYLFFVRRRRTEKEKRKIFGERKYVSVEEKKNGDELQGSKKGGE